MRSTQLFEAIEFDEARPLAKPLYVDEHGRILLFALRPGQTIREHSAPHSPFYALVLQGTGAFAGEDGQEQRFGPNALLIFAPDELHSVRALDDDLVFVGFLHGAPAVRSGKTGGELGREE
jgi:quercetin dioxygenase-like cupin family protein